MYLVFSAEYLTKKRRLAHQNRTITIASDFRVDGAKSPAIPQKEWVSGSEIAARNRKSLATFHRNAALLCLVSEIACDFCGSWRASQWLSQKSLRFRCAKVQGLAESAKVSENLHLGSACPLRFVPLSAPWEKIKSCKKAGLHYSNYFPHSTERKTVTVTEIVVGSKEDQHQSLHYSN